MSNEQRSRWFGVYEFRNAGAPRPLCFVKAVSAGEAFAKAVHGGGNICGTVHVHTVEVEDYSIPKPCPVKLWDGEAWQPAVDPWPPLTDGTTLHHLMHRLWTKAVGTVDYSKAEWKRLEAMIRNGG
jgi:hypothetical protein